MVETEQVVQVEHLVGLSEEEMNVLIRALNIAMSYWNEEGKKSKPDYKLRSTANQAFQIASLLESKLLGNTELYLHKGVKG